MDFSASQSWSLQSDAISVVTHCGLLWRTWTVQVLWGLLMAKCRELTLQRHSASLPPACETLWSCFSLAMEIGTFRISGLSHVAETLETFLEEKIPQWEWLLLS